ncbi:hypothetical protein U7230_07730 [Carboxydochorda subterranea]|uniref:Uncharacterized protein n=1 Tax=Carboxydichorda subterranea TaxID=3109565 RepID=A0ABZ1C229_9FIRM|nr:hypothetical protein [Limnochorda sp. L945t]WRP18870.1 hypothetical protein U7230_07730 [Limnochorda sp. L945t]
MPNQDAQPSGRKRSTRYPQVSLKRCEELARQLYALGARRVHVDKLAEALGYRSAKSGVFLSLKAAASYFGLVEYEDPQYLSLPADVIAAYHSGSEAELRRLRVQAIRRPPLYQKLLKKYEGKQLPPLRRLQEELFLFPEYGILKEAAEGAAKAFIESLKYAGVVDENGFASFTESQPEKAPAALSTSDTQGRGPQPEAAVSEERETKPATREAEAGTTRYERDVYDITLELGQRAHLELPPYLTDRDKKRLKAILDATPEPSSRDAVDPA